MRMTRPEGNHLLKRDCDETVGGQTVTSGDRSLDAVLVTALLLVGVASTLVFADQLSKTQRMQLTDGSVGGAVGLLLGYGVLRLRP